MTNYAILSDLPQPEEELMNGVKWGRCDELFTPAYWKVQYALHEDSFEEIDYRTGESLIHEVCACLLGGFGIKAEMAMAAFKKLKEDNLLNFSSTYESIVNCLEKPLNVNGSTIRYRFPRQKAKFLHEFLRRPDLAMIPTNDDMELRTWLLSVNGIGLKTASWITRNWLNSSNVAIVDIHILRAGQLAGFFDPELSLSLEKNYLLLEQQYLQFCEALNVNAANMDALIWKQLKQVNNIALSILKSA